MSKIALKSKNMQWPVSSLRPSIAAMHAPLPGWVNQRHFERAAGTSAFYPPRQEGRITAERSDAAILGLRDRLHLAAD